MKKIIITGKTHPYLMETLQQKGFEVLYKPDITTDELDNIIQGAEGLIVTTRIKADRKLIDKAVSLKWDEGKKRNRNYFPKTFA